MSENVTQTVLAEKRRRINRLKKIIIITAITLIIIPIILCIVLLFKMSSMQEEIDNLLEMRNAGTIVATLNDQGQVRYVYADTLDTADKDEGTEVAQKQDKEPEPEEKQTEEIKKEEQATNNEIEKETVMEQIDTGKYAYLTFDDGPSENTDQILEILKKYNVTATFFVVGKEDEESKARYKAIVDSGNSIGLHSYTHSYMDIYSSVESFANDLNRISDTVFEATGQRTMLYRFPGGSSNAIVDDISIYIDYLNNNGYTYYDWNSSSRDASSNVPTKEAIIDVVITEAAMYDDVMVLMHDASNKDTTVEALPELIEKLQDMGFTIKGIDENSVPVQHR